MTTERAARFTALSLGLLLSLSAWAWNESSEYREQALALKPNLYNGMQIFRACAKCHHKHGWGQRSGLIPQIAGQHAKVLIKQMTDVKERNRETSGMDHFIMLRSIADPQFLADVSTYVSELPMTPRPGVGPGDNLEKGKQLYTSYCAGCHGEDGAGDSDKFYPRIHGQHYKYLLRQFNWIYRRERLNAHPGMMNIIAGFSDEDAEAVIDYVSRLRPPKDKVAPSWDWENPDFD